MGDKEEKRSKSSRYLPTRSILSVKTWLQSISLPTWDITSNIFFFYHTFVAAVLLKHLQIIIFFPENWCALVFMQETEEIIWQEKREISN